jgi:negative regulator of flagellin synthesis FlgM
MSIEINGTNSRPPVEAADPRKPADEQGQTAASSASTSPAGGSTDKLSLTNQAAQLQALEEEIAALPAVDTQRVQEVQRSLATGSFQVDAARVADKLLSFEAGLGSGQ